MDDRRSFLARVGLALPAVGLATGAAEAQASPNAGFRAGIQVGVRDVPRHALDAWMDTLGSGHRLVLDATTPSGAIEAVMYGWNFLRTSGGPYGLADRDHGLILVLRHHAMVMALPQPLWAKYPGMVPPAFDNPIADAKATESVLRPGAAQRIPEPFQLDGLATRGVHFAICQTALDRNAAKVAAGGDAKAVIAEFTAALPANAHVMPSGITAVQRAQEYGYSHAHAG